MRHQGGIRIGGARLEVGATLVSRAFDRPIGCTVASQPVVAVFVGVGELLAFGLGDRDGKCDRPVLAFS
jgi:hypothetical protein